VSGEVVKFPIGRVVRFDKLIHPLDYTPPIKELDRSLRSIERAIRAYSASGRAFWRDGVMLSPGSRKRNMRPAWRGEESPTRAIGRLMQIGRSLNRTEKFSI
jgi:hypothetical protein